VGEGVVEGKSLLSLNWCDNDANGNLVVAIKMRCWVVGVCCAAR
jgi:hypothetical protein